MPIKLNGATSGSVELDVPAAVGSDLQLTLSATAGEVVVKAADGSVDLGDVAIDSSGNLGIGSSSPNAKLQVNSGDINIVARSGSTETGIFFRNPNDNATYAKIGYTDSTGTLVLGTTNTYSTVFVSNDTERMRLDSAGNVFFGKTSTSTTTAGVAFTPGNAEFTSFTNNTSDTGARVILINRQGSGNGGRHIEFRMGNSFSGSINGSGTTTSYNTNSDYRLKQNVINITDGIARVKQLQPKRFNFIVNPETTVDGFIAHEAQTVVPESIVGEKDAIDTNGEPVYQGIDQSKLVPLLTAALQEAIAKIETLETKVAALEATP